MLVIITIINSYTHISRTGKNLDSENTGLAKAQKRVSKGFSKKIKMSGLTKSLSKCDKKGLTKVISLI